VTRENTGRFRTSWVQGVVGPGRSINAAVESVFSLLQENVLNSRRLQTRDQLPLAVVTWIDTTYHRRRDKTDSTA